MNGTAHRANGAAHDANGAAHGPAGPGGGGEPLPTDLDELARRLLDPMSALLRNALWMDRERAGMITDLRR